MKSLYQLTSAKTLLWKPEYEEIRTKIISILTEHPVLVIYDPQHEIELHTDASSEGYGAIMMHKIDNKCHPIEYYSKTTSTAERNYHSYELETLAVVKSVKHFRYYLQGKQFTVFTDCNSVKFSLTKSELTPRAQRWWAFLQNFDFTVVYREGKKMAHVDFLSRNPICNKVYEKVEQKQINFVEITNDWLRAEQAIDPEISSLVAKIRNHELEKDVAHTYDLRNGLLYRKIKRNGKTKCLPIVPRAFRWSVVNHVHDSIMHLGWEKTLDKIYHWRPLRIKITKL